MKVYSNRSKKQIWGEQIELIEMKNQVMEIKNSVDKSNRILDTVEERIRKIRRQLLGCYLTSLSENVLRRRHFVLTKVWPPSQDNSPSNHWLTFGYKGPSWGTTNSGQFLAWELPLGSLRLYHSLTLPESSPAPSLPQDSSLLSHEYLGTSSTAKDLEAMTAR